MQQLGPLAPLHPLPPLHELQDVYMNCVGPYPNEIVGNWEAGRLVAARVVASVLAYLCPADLVGEI